MEGGIKSRFAVATAELRKGKEGLLSHSYTVLYHCKRRRSLAASTGLSSPGYQTDLICAMFIWDIWNPLLVGSDSLHALSLN
jgi:hypothetical protein